jgi:hypothetical protein
MFGLIGVFIQLAVLGLELLVRFIFGAGRLLGRAWKHPAGKVILCGLIVSAVSALILASGAASRGKTLGELSALEAGDIMGERLVYIAQTVWAFIVGVFTSEPVQTVTQRMWHGLFVEVFWGLEVNHLMFIALGAYSGRFIHVNLDGLLDADTEPHESTLPRREPAGDEWNPLP